MNWLASTLSLRGKSTAADTKMYTVEVPDVPAVEGEGRPRRSHVLIDDQAESGAALRPLVDTQDAQVCTLWDNFSRGCRVAGIYDDYYCDCSFCYYCDCCCYLIGIGISCFICRR